VFNWCHPSVEHTQPAETNHEEHQYDSLSTPYASNRYRTLATRVDLLIGLTEHEQPCPQILVGRWTQPIESVDASAAPAWIQATAIHSRRLFMDELTQRLTIEQPIVLGGSQPTLEELRKRVGEMGYVLVKFTETQGGTELGVRLDLEATDLGAADFDKGVGVVHVEGFLILNDDPVRCIADIDVATLKGTGRLTPVDKSLVFAEAE
jgi:hypothetical protein